MTVYATFICRDGFKRQEILMDLYPTYRLPCRPGNRLWMSKLEHAVALPKQEREFYLDSKKIITNEYGKTAQAIYREL